MDTTFVHVTNISDLGSPTILGISVDTAVSAFIAMIVFGLGLFFTRKFESVKRHKYLGEVESYLYTVFSDLNDSITERISSFTELVNQLGKKEHADLSMKYVSDYSVELIQEIDWIDYYNVFSMLKIDSDKSLRIFKNINKSLAVIKDIDTLWQSSFSELKSRQGEYEKRWNFHISGIGSVTDDFVSAHKSSYTKGTDPFIDELDKTLVTFQRTDNAADLYVAYKTLITPLHNLIKNNPEEEWGRRFLDNVMGCIYAYDNYTKNRSAFEQQFNIYKEKLENARAKLGSEVDDLKELKNSKPRIISVI